MDFTPIQTFPHQGLIGVCITKIRAECAPNPFPLDGLTGVCITKIRAECAPNPFPLDGGSTREAGDGGEIPAFKRVDSRYIPLSALDGGSTREAGDGGEIPAFKRVDSRYIPLSAHQGGRDKGLVIIAAFRQEVGGFLKAGELSGVGTRRTAAFLHVGGASGRRRRRRRIRARRRGGERSPRRRQVRAGHDYMRRLLRRRD